MIPNAKEVIIKWSIFILGTGGGVQREISNENFSKLSVFMEYT